MTVFRVKRDYLNGKWIENHPNPVIEVRASNAKEAAEFACGTTLKTRGHAGEYRAKVWPLGGVRYAHEIAHFYTA